MAGKAATRANAAWTKLLTAKSIDLSTASFPLHLEMRDLKNLGGHEPRLMNSMDEREKWPAILRGHGVFPLSTSRSSLALVKGEPFFDLPPVSTPTIDYESRLPIKFVSGMLGQGENVHITRLHTAGFLQQFLDSSELYFVTSGRRTSPRFRVIVNSQEISVDGVQYEMDGQYESAEDVVPIEMKTADYASCAIKQVYLPYRALGEDTSWQKPVRPLYITYSEASDEYVVRELRFARRDLWDSIQVEKAQNVRLRLVSPPSRVLNFSVPLLESTRVPQADVPRRIQALPGAVRRGINTANLLAEAFRFDRRQSSYYRDAAEMLGLIMVEDGNYVLTPDGRRFVDRSPQQQADELAARMYRLPAVNAVLEEMEDRGSEGLPIDEVDVIVKKHAESHRERFTGSTVGRRGQTIRAWLKFIGSRTGAVVLTEGRLYLRKDVRRLDQFL